MGRFNSDGTWTSEVPGSQPELIDPPRKRYSVRTTDTGRYMVWNTVWDMAVFDVCGDVRTWQNRAGAQSLASRMNRQYADAVSRNSAWIG